MCNPIQIDSVSKCLTCGLYAINVKYHLFSLTHLMPQLNSLAQPQETRMPSRQRMVMGNTMDTIPEFVDLCDVEPAHSGPQINRSYSEVLRSNPELELLSRPPSPK